MYYDDEIRTRLLIAQTIQAVLERVEYPLTIVTLKKAVTEVIETETERLNKMFTAPPGI